MGAGQSSGNSDARVDQQVKTSYYELLSVERHATDDEIKKAYRRKALELHPDRNYGNEEEATRIFAEVQTAYEILSDPQERAWYDSHESAILRGDDGAQEEVHTYQNVRVTTADDLARVLRKFNSNVEFSDAPSGFFGFLSEQFEHLAKEEEIAAAWDNVEAREYPPFGHKNDAHEDVVRKFYAAWTSFSTVKSFAWKDKYRLSEAPDRRVRRLMEKENSNLRQEAIREFNDAVRAFVLFVRKRDPRYTPSTQSEEERQRMLRDAAAAQAARARAANQAAAQGEVPAWAQHRKPEELEESSEEEAEQEVIECVACNKTFKSERQYEAHEKSKKHQKAISALKRQMRKDNANLDLSDHQAGDSGDDAEWDIIGDEPASPTSDEPDVVHVDVPQDDSPETKEPEVIVVAEDHDTDLDPTSDIDTDEDAPADDVDAVSDTQLASELDKAALLGPVDDDSEQGSTLPAKKIGKAAQKRAKKAAAASAAQESANIHRCAGCDAAFPSRTRLFQHIKDHGHAALKGSTGPPSKSKKGKAQK